MVNNNNKKTPLDPIPECVSCPYHVLKMDGTIHSVNDAWVDTLGYDEPEIQSTKFSQLVTGHTSDNFEYITEKLNKEQHVSNVFLELSKKSGDRVPIMYSSQVETTEDNDSRHRHAQFTPVPSGSHHSTAESHQPYAEAKSKAVDEAPIGITLSDPSKKDNPLVYVNDQFVDTTGYPIDRAIGENCRYLQGKETDEATVSAIRDAVNNEEPISVELRNYQKNGDEFWNRLQITPIYDDDGNVEFFAGFQEDITERKKYENRLREQRDNLALLNKMLRHDIRNLLQLIVSHGEFISKEGVRSGDNKEHAQIIIDQAERAVELTRSAGELSDLMLEHDEQLHSVDIRTVLYEEIEKMREAHPEASIITQQPLADTKVIANGLLNSVFRNVLKNAIEHNQNDIPEVVVSTTTNTDVVKVQIADNGPGLDRQNLLTAPSASDEIEDKDNTGGLGLRIINQVVDSYNGDVWAETSENDGTIINIEIPACESS